MSLPDILPISPFTRPARGEVILPGSKSLTNRALLLAALCDQPVKLQGALFSEDTELMAAALAKLGFKISSDAKAGTIEVSGQSRVKEITNGAPPIDLSVGLAGTTARFLTAFCAAAPAGSYRIDGVPQMRKRPMKSLIDGLRALGAKIHCPEAEGFFPLEIQGVGLRGGSVSIDASESSQLLSALLMVAPRASASVCVQLSSDVRWTFVEMTRRLLQEFGISIERIDAAEGAVFKIEPSCFRSPGTYTVEPDATAASYFQALPHVVGGQLELPGLRAPGAGLQGDSAFIEVLQRVSQLPREEDFHEISDTFLTLAAIAPLLPGPTRITGIAHTRKQETDRVAGMANELRRLGQDVVEEHDALTITPRPLRADQIVETYGDHRFAMSFGILGCYDLHRNGRAWLSVKNPACCAKTFPHFFELLESLRIKSLSA